MILKFNEKYKEIVLHTSLMYVWQKLKQNVWYPKFDMENSASIRKPSPLCFCTVLFLCVYVLNIYQDTFCFQNFPP